MTEFQSLLSETALYSKNCVFFVETRNFDQKAKVFDLVFKKLVFLTWKTWFFNWKIDLQDKDIDFLIEILGFSIEILGLWQMASIKYWLILNQYLTDTFIGIYWLIIGLYSLIIGNYWIKLSKSCHMRYWLNIC